MALKLKKADFDRLVKLISSRPQIQTVGGRTALITQSYVTYDTYGVVTSNIQYDGESYKFVINLLQHLLIFGEVAEGEEALSPLLDTLRQWVSPYGDEATFIQSLFEGYPLKVEPTTIPVTYEPNIFNPPAPARTQPVENTLRHIFVLERAMSAANAVFKIELANQSAGTGFMIADDLMMTCDFNINLQSPSTAKLHFNYQLDGSGHPATVHTARIADDGILYSSQALHSLVCRIDNAPADLNPLVLRRMNLEVGLGISIIQHPNGDYKQISMQNNFVSSVENEMLQYVTFTQAGAAGAPVFNDDFEVIAIHHSRVAGTKDEKRGTKIGVILDEIQKKAPDLYARLTVR